MLKNDKFAIKEFGMETDLNELHEYQKRIDSCEITYSKISPFIIEAEQLKSQVKELKQMIIPTRIQHQSDNCFIDENDEKFHQVLSKIGEGATSVVYKILDTRTNQIMCKKILKICKNDEVAFTTLKSAIKEFEILSKINFPGICQVIGINTSEIVTDSNISNKNEPEITTIALFLEFQDYSLAECLKNMNNTLKTRIVIEIAHAMNFIHKKGLIHRDLKIDNIRLNSVYEAKIIDFGLVRIHECLLENYSFIKESITKGVGTFMYMSPEMLNEEDYDYKTDVYSFGIVLHFIFVGSIPKQSLTDKMTGKKIVLPKESHDISTCCIDLISKCLSFKPSERPTFEEILKIIRNNDYSLADFVDQRIVSKRDIELQLFEKYFFQKQ